MHKIRWAAVVVAVMASTLLTAAPAQAASVSADFGQNVATCAQTMGFTGAMNPGVHDGKSGWDPSHDCSMS